MLEQSRLTTNIVPPCGPLDAKACIIGQAPGEEEDYSLEPFTGEAGQFMSRVMRQVDLLRSEFLINNVFCQRPPENNVGYFFEDKKNTKLNWEGREHVENLRRWLEDLNPRPNLLIAAGREALMILTGKRRIWKWRGSILPCTLVPGYKVYATLHPSGILRLLNEPEQKLMGAKKEYANNAYPLFLRDWERIKIQMEFPEIRRPQRTFDLDLSIDEILAKLEWLNSQAYVAVDIETLYGPEGPVIWMIGFSPRPDYAFVIYLIRNGRFAWPLHHEAAIWQAVSRLFLNPKVSKVFQNGGYDLSILGRYYGLRVASGSYEDTMWCHHASFPQIKKSLEVLCSIYTWQEYYKDEGKVHYGKRTGDKAEGDYNCKDTTNTREIFPIVRDNAAIMNTLEGYRRSMSFMPSLLSMMIRGVRIDHEKKEQLQIEFGKRAAIAQQSVNQLEGEYVNLNSSQQIISLLYYKHQFKEQRKRNKKRSLTADKDAREKLKRLYPNEPVIQHINDFKKFDKLRSTYAEMELDIDGRVRTSYGFISTWRLSSSESHFGSGGNLQNIPVRTEEGKEVRRLFITDPMEPYTEEEWKKVVELVTRVCGKKVAATLVNGVKLMLAADKRQAEAMVVAWEAEDIERIELFQSGQDVHWHNTRQIFDMPRQLSYNKQDEYIDYITNEPHTHDDYRRLGKTTKHARNYGMGPYMLQTILAREGFVLPYRACVQLLEAHPDPILDAWHRDVRDRIRAQRMLVSSFGRVRYFYGRLNDSTWRVGYAFSPQNTVGEILEQGIQRIEDTTPWIENLLNVHDEVVTQIEPHTIVESIHWIKKNLSHPMNIKGRMLDIPDDFKAGTNWGDLVEFKPDFSTIAEVMKGGNYDLPIQSIHSY